MKRKSMKRKNDTTAHFFQDSLLFYNYPFYKKKETFNNYTFSVRILLNILFDFFKKISQLHNHETIEF